MLKAYFDGYGVGGAFPGESDIIDYTSVTKSPPIYTFGTMLDTTCSPTVWQ
jgi:hypothetical protein